MQADFFTEFVPGARCHVCDLAELDIDEKFDVAIAMESLTHVDRPLDALRRIRERASRILIRDHVSFNEGNLLTEWKMRAPSHEEFRGLVEQAGFTIEHDESLDVAWAASVRFWMANIESAFPIFIPDGQFKVLHNLCQGLVFTGNRPLDIRVLVAS
jgi:cyclopropane fatty-acyl-phospholipid synthase-like methyltransferase